jgi:hypothetical protein
MDAAFDEGHIVSRGGFRNGFAEFHKVDKIKDVEEYILTIKNGQLAPFAAGKIEKCYLGFH